METDVAWLTPVARSAGLRPPGHGEGGTIHEDTPPTGPIGGMRSSQGLLGVKMPDCIVPDTA